MYEGNHKIDNPNNKWTDREVENLFIFCQLDRAMPYEKVCEIYTKLINSGITFHKLRDELTVDDLSKLLKKCGLRFPRQTATFLHYNANFFCADSLRNMTRDEISEQCKGFGMKLASMFHNRIHDSNYAIIDVHIDRFLKQYGCFEKNYKKKEKYLQKIAKKNDMTMEQLDWKIWNRNRIGNRK